MAYADGGFSGRPITLRLLVTPYAPDVANNRTLVDWTLIAIKNGNTTANNSSGPSWAVSFDGVPHDSGSWTYDFTSLAIGDYIVIDGGNLYVNHNPDGTKTLAFAASADGGVPLGTASAPGSTTLTAIARASTPTYTVGGSPATAVDAGVTVTINTNRASGSFTHDITWSFGSQSGTVATGVGASTTWTPALSLLNEIPNATSGVVTLTTVTKNGGSTIGSKSTVLTLNVPSSVIPDFTTVTHSEATTTPNINTLIGAYVKDWTKLNVAITGAAGVYGSTITSYKIEVAFYTINAASGQTGVIGQSGTLLLRGTITDSRGRVKIKDVNITVLNYGVPTIPASTAVRSDAGGTVNPNGDRIKVSLTGATWSLINGSQKNSIKYTVRIKQSTSGTAWPSVTPAVGPTTLAATTGYTGSHTLATYSVANSYIVRIEVEDVFGQVSYVELTVPTGGTFAHFEKNADRSGWGKFNEGYATMEIQDDLWATSEVLIGPSRTPASTAVKATGAEVITGTDDDKFVTPLALQSLTATDTRDGIVELATVAESTTGTDTARAVTPAGLSAAILAGTPVIRVRRNTNAPTVSTTFTNLSTTANWLTTSPAQNVGFAAYSNGITIPITGVYELGYEFVSTAGVSILAGLTINDTTVVTGDLICATSAGVAAGVTALNASGEFRLTAGDVIRLYAIATSGTPALTASMGQFYAAWRRNP